MYSVLLIRLLGWPGPSLSVYASKNIFHKTNENKKTRGLLTFRIHTAEPHLRFPIVVNFSVDLFRRHCLIMFQAKL